MLWGGRGIRSPVGLALIDSQRILPSERCHCLHTCNKRTKARPYWVWEKDLGETERVLKVDVQNADSNQIEL